ncbi:hypothetical protein D9M71_503050 [compost metagenome]
MDSCKNVALRTQIKDTENLTFRFCFLAENKRSVIHHITYAHHMTSADSFACQRLDRRRIRREQKVTGMVGEATVYLFRHTFVERAKPSFNMRQGNMQLNSSKRAGECRIRIAINKYPVGALAHQYSLDGLEHTPGILPVAATTNP